MTVLEPRLRPVDGDGDHDLFAHIVVPAHAAVEAAVTGKPCTALCGKEWVPTRDPEGLPVCPTCKEIFATM